jgi:signal peptidase II
VLGSRAPPRAIRSAPPAYDRFIDGYVVDYLHFHWGEHYFPAFNVADIAITTGAIMLIIDALLDSRRRRAVPG